jgi:hypothetical protein
VEDDEDMEEVEAEGAEEKTAAKESGHEDVETSRGAALQRKRKRGAEASVGGKKKKAAVAGT